MKFNEKQRITAVCAIVADVFKFPFQFIAKGKTEQVLDTQIGDVSHHNRSFPENGWTNTQTFYVFFSVFHNEDNIEIHVILDLYKAHNNEEIKEAAAALGIIIHFIPSGFINMFQPLDSMIFAIIKTYIRQMVRQLLLHASIIKGRKGSK